MVTFCRLMKKSDFTQWLQNELKKKGWTQADFARATGISPTQVARIISGERGLGIESLVSISNVFNISPITLLEKLGLITSNSNQKINLADWERLLSQINDEDREEIYEILVSKANRRKKA